MSIAVISDLHIGALDGADDFAHKESDFLRFLDRLEAQAERIVLLGDIWESLTPHNPLRVRTGIRRCKEAYPKIAKRFEQPNYVYVYGNHDWIAREEGAHRTYAMDVAGTRMLFIHGHQHDRILRHARFLGDWGIWMGGWIRRMGLQPLYRWASKIFGHDHQKLADPKSCSFQSWAVARAQCESADVIVTGHTHFAVRAEHQQGLFLNSGSCAGADRSFLLLEPKAGRFDVLRE